MNDKFIEAAFKEIMSELRGMRQSLESMEQMVKTAKERSDAQQKNIEESGCNDAAGTSELNFGTISWGCSPVAASDPKAGS
jgi:hypothetical protein